MTEEAMKRLVWEALDLTAVEVQLIEIIRENIDPAQIAEAIYFNHEEALIEAAAQAISERFLPF